VKKRRKTQKYKKGGERREKERTGREVRERQGERERGGEKMEGDGDTKLTRRWSVS